MSLPSRLHGPILGVLKHLGVPVFSPHTPNPAPATVFLLDGDYIIADDFEVDVPEFTHNPAWFQPVQSDEAG
jgi:hypothetical protein